MSELALYFNQSELALAAYANLKNELTQTATASTNHG